MDKIYSHFNTKARGLSDFKDEAPKFESNKKISLEELESKKEASSMAIRGAGSGKFQKRRKSAGFDEGTQVDFVVLNDRAFYVGDIKKDNQILHPIEDVGMVNFSAGIVVSIDNSKSLVMADIDRLVLGDPSLKNKVNFDQSKKLIASNGKKYQLNNAKSLSLMTTIPENNLNGEIKKLSDEIYLQFQNLHDYSLSITEKSAIGSGPSFKRQSMFLSSKDVLRGLIKSGNPEATDDEVKNIVGIVFSDNGVGPLSTMSLELSFTITKVMRTKDVSDYPEYSEIDEKNSALRTFVTAFNVNVPINPSVLVEISTKIEKFKEALLSHIIKIHNEALDENAEGNLIPFPDLTIQQHNIAGITKEEFDHFQTQELPKLARLGIETARQLDDTRARKRLIEIKEEENDDDYNA